MDPGAAGAIMAAVKKVNADRQDPSAWITLGEAYFAHNLFELATPCFAQALKLDSAQPKAAYLLATCHNEMGNPQQRDQLIERVIELDSSNSIPRWRAASWALSEGKIAEASSLAESALKIEESDGNTRKVLAQVRLAQGDPQGAITLLAPLVQGNTADLYARYLLGRAFQATGQEGKAQRQLTLAASARENFQDQWLDEAGSRRADLPVGLSTIDSLLSRRDLSKARTLLDNLQTRYGAIRELQLRRAELLARESKSSEALAANQTLLESHPEWGPALTHRANLALTSFMQNPNGSAEYLQIADAHARKATQLTPGSLDAWEILSKVSAVGRNNQMALHAFTKCVELAPNVPRFRAAKAEFLIAQGRIQEADAAIQEMEMLFGQTIESTLAQIQLLMITDRKEEAMILLARCRQMAPNHPAVRRATQQLMGQP